VAEIVCGEPFEPGVVGCLAELGAEGPGGDVEQVAVPSPATALSTYCGVGTSRNSPGFLDLSGPWLLSDSCCWWTRSFPFWNQDDSTARASPRRRPQPRIMKAAAKARQAP
jgi:hypothetical protein